MFRKYLIFFVDSSVIFLASIFAFNLRFDFSLPNDWNWFLILQGAFSTLMVQWLFLWIFRCNKILWRYCSIHDIGRFVIAALFAMSIQLILRLIFPGNIFLWLRPPMSVTLMSAFFILGGLLGIRFLFRWVCETVAFSNFSANTRRALIFGAGVTGSRIVNELEASNFMVLGFIDDDENKNGFRIHGIPVLGSSSQISSIVKKNSITDLIVAVSAPKPELLKKLADLIVHLNVSLRIVPSVSKWSGNSLRQVDVIDLLGRSEQNPDNSAAFELLNLKTVMITGAGGSIGSEISRQVVKAGAKKIILIDQSENALYEIHRELSKIENCGDLVPVIADCAERARMDAILAESSPEIILHAAAYKHVPMMELNPIEAFRNNVIATQNLAECALKAKVGRFVMISSDKAVRPTSIMGLTKRLAEVAIRSLNGKGSTIFTMVRFGNVLDSSGSVIPLFREQIAAGGPVTVTHKDMQRYFMTISESVSLVLQAASLAKGGEIFILDMGEPVRIVDLAETMITLSGKRLNTDIKILYTGVRPGEKLFEELDVSDKNAIKTGLARIFIGKITPVTEEKAKEYLTICRNWVETNSIPDNAAIMEKFSDLRSM